MVEKLLNHLTTRYGPVAVEATDAPSPADRADEPRQLGTGNTPDTADLRCSRTGSAWSITLPSTRHHRPPPSVCLLSMQANE